MALDCSGSKTPDWDLVMPHTPEVVFTIILHLITLGYVVYGTHLFINKKSPYLLCFVAGGYVASFFEPIVDVNAMCYFPNKGQITSMYSYGRGIPILVLTVYAWFVGGQGYLYKATLDSGRLTKTTIWRGWLLTMVVNLMLEIPMLSFKMYCYYGPHPFKIAGFPLYWAIVNAIMPMVSGFAVHTLAPHLTGWKVLVSIAIIPLADGYANASLGFPMWWALNSEYDYAATYPAFFVTLGLAILTVWIISLYLPETVESKSTDAEREPLIH